MQFLKMNGLGNEFIVIDARKTMPPLGADAVRLLADHKTGPGCDQFITLETSPNGADIFMRIHNADGGEVEACGNATRCVARLVMAETGRDRAVVETVVGHLIGARGADDTMVTVDMGVPKFGWKDIPLSEPFEDTRAIELQIGPIDAPILHTPSVVNVGNPHAIFWVKNDVESYGLESNGPLLENHMIFPQRANISLAQILSRSEMVLKVWERGVGLTRACGTAACAATVAAIRNNLTDRKVLVHLPGGDLSIYWRETDDHIMMSGATELEYAGEIDLDDLSWRKLPTGGAE
ncbi:diaminopimelate epimerase [uncultured Cohaesibacter sp.]|uniref:diaminopimelate epimerase n=1 Tax=uncultured Cohaesibacter sp. TaxID=1002546 RepID=UPI00292DF50B|nr:diaminopimelate epimerase [uncultured Cohaesibacter sp.]